MSLTQGQMRLQTNEENGLPAAYFQAETLCNWPTRKWILTDC